MNERDDDGEMVRSLEVTKVDEFKYSGSAEVRVKEESLAQGFTLVVCNRTDSDSVLCTD